MASPREHRIRNRGQREVMAAAAIAGEAGRKGADVRSDCWVRLSPRSSGGLQLVVRSRVEALYGDSIRALIGQTLGQLGVAHADVEIDDAGALPWAIAARVEAGARRAGAVNAGAGGPGATGAPSREAIPPWGPNTQYPTSRERLRRSRLYLPGNEPKFMLNAGLHRPDGVILDLEDSVAPAEKDAARVLVRNALRSVDFCGAERMVRINQGDAGLEDLEAVVPHNVHVVLIPKVEAPEQVLAVEARIAEIEARAQRSSGHPGGSDAGSSDAGASHLRASDAGASHPGSSRPRASAPGVLLMPIIESARGALRAYEIAAASPRVVALTIGLEDYTADIGAVRTRDGRESFWARCQVVNAARAAGVQPIDSVFSDVGDLEGLRASVREARELGFEGKGCIHPRQIRVIHEAFAPSPEELDRARRIVAAFADAQARGLGAVALGSKMIDPPIVRRAEQLVRQAEQASEYL